MRTVPLAVVLLAWPLLAFAQAQVCQELEAAKKRTYGFRPSTFTPQQQDQKVKELDAFWSLIKARGRPGTDCLRGMILAERTDGFFLFDATSLLVGLDPSHASAAAITHGLLNTDLGEVDPAGYIKLVVWLSKRGTDIGPFAAKYLSHPKVDASLPEHGGMKVDREAGAIFLYGSMPTALADQHLIAALEAKEPYARQTAAQVLALSMTEESFRALKSWSGMAHLSESARKNVEWITKRSPATVTARPRFSRAQVLAKIRQIPDALDSVDQELAQAAVATLTAADLDILREARRRSIRSVSDESLSRYFDLTKVLLGVINRLGLYGQYRLP